VKHIRKKEKLPAYYDFDEDELIKALDVPIKDGPMCMSAEMYEDISNWKKKNQKADVL